MRRAARVYAILALAVCEGCSVYDESLSTAGENEDGGEAGANDAPSAPDSSGVVDGESPDASDPTEADALFEGAAEEAKSDVQDAAFEEVATHDAGPDADDAGWADRDASPDEPSPPSPRPVDVVLGGNLAPSGLRSPGPSGNAFSQTCMPNEVLIGYSGTVGGSDASVPVLRTFRAVCGSLSVTGTTAFTVATTAAETLPIVGLAAGQTQQVQLCNASEVVVGFSGRSGSDIDQIVIHCAPLIISGSAPAYVVSVGAPNARPALGGSGGEPFAAIGCPSGQVAVGNEGRAAYTINAFGLLCRVPVLVVQ